MIPVLFETSIITLQNKYKLIDLSFDNAYLGYKKKEICSRDN